MKSQIEFQDLLGEYKSALDGWFNAYFMLRDMELYEKELSRARELKLQLDAIVLASPSWMTDEMKHIWELEQ